MRIKDLEKIKSILESCQSRFDDKEWKLDVKISIAKINEEIIRQEEEKLKAKERRKK